MEVVIISRNGYDGWYNIGCMERMDESDLNIYSDGIYGSEINWRLTASISPAARHLHETMV